MNHLIQRLIQDFIRRFLVRNAWLVVLLGAVATLIGGYYTVKLYQNLKTDLEELLPNTARSVRDLSEVTQRLESVENLAVLVFSKDTEASRRFVDDLVEKLKAAPSDTIASVEYKIDRELKFFVERKALYMDLSDVRRVRQYIQSRVEYEKEIRNPLVVFFSPGLPVPRYDFKALLKKYEKQTSAYSRFPRGYYATPDEQKRVVLVYLPGKSSGIAANHRLKDYVERAVGSLHPQTYAPDITVAYTGGVENTIEEQEALVADLVVSSAIVLSVVFIAMFIFFADFRATLALVLSLGMGTIWTFGVAYFAVGYLNANSAFLGSIVIGNGINYGIILLARYLEIRRGGGSHDKAITLAMSDTWVPTAAAALAAGLSYGSLMLTGFRGFKQFGLIGLIGMALCWTSAYTLLPALLTLFDHPRSPRAAVGSKPGLGVRLARVVSRSPRWISGVSLLATGVSLAFLLIAIIPRDRSPRFADRILETDLLKLRSKHSMEKGSGFLSRYVDEIFQRYLSPIVIMPRTREGSRKIALKLDALRESEGPSSLIASVQTLDDFIPPWQEAKVSELKQIQKLLPPERQSLLSPHERDLLHQFLTRNAFQVVRENRLPGLLIRKFTERDGSVGKLVLAEPPIQSLNGSDLIRFIHELRATADSVEQGTPLVGSLAISSDMIEAVSREGPRATLYAFLAVVVLVIVLFRKPKIVGLILVTLIWGVTWMAGIITGAGLKINFLNFIALPITFGIGVDYGVNILHRFQVERRAGVSIREAMIRVIGKTGGAVALCSFTTVVGYGSLLLADNRAFVSFGLLAILGEITCASAAVIALPALLMIGRSRRSG